MTDNERSAWLDAVLYDPRITLCALRFGAWATQHIVQGKPISLWGYEKAGSQNTYLFTLPAERRAAA
jgi:hypothetical protein